MQSVTKMWMCKKVQDIECYNVYHRFCVGSSPPNLMTFGILMGMTHFDQHSWFSETLKSICMFAQIPTYCNW